MKKLLHTVRQEDIGKNVITVGDCKHCGAKGRAIWLTDVCGRILKCDVGKRIYDVNGVVQIENDEQLKARLAKGER